MKKLILTAILFVLLFSLYAFNPRGFFFELRVTNGNILDYVDVENPNHDPDFAVTVTDVVTGDFISTDTVISYLLRVYQGPGPVGDVAWLYFDAQGFPTTGYVPEGREFLVELTYLPNSLPETNTQTKTCFAPSGKGPIFSYGDEGAWYLPHEMFDIFYPIITLDSMPPRAMILQNGVELGLAPQIVDPAEAGIYSAVLAGYSFEDLVVTDISDDIEHTFMGTYLDLQAPQNPYPANGSMIWLSENNPLILSWEAPSQGIAPDGYIMQFNGGAAIDVGAQLSWSIADLDVGYYTWKVTPYYMGVLAAQTVQWSFEVRESTVIIDFNEEFGDVWVDHNVSRNMTIQNIGRQVLDVNIMMSSGNFTIDPPAGTFQIASGSQLQFQIDFFASTLGSFSRNIYIETSDPAASLIILTLNANSYELNADFTMSPESGYLPLEVEFDAILQPQHVNWYWDFGDGNSFEGNNIIHNYQEAGIYEVELTVEDAWGFTNSSTQNVEVFTWAQVQIEQESLNFSEIYIGDNSQITLDICNIGPDTLNIIAIGLQNSDSAFSIVNFPDLDILEPQTCSTLQIDFSPLQLGLHTNVLIIETNSLEDSVKYIPMQGVGVYAPPRAPANLLITMDGDDALLSWEEVTSNIIGLPITVSYYFIYGAKLPDADPGHQFFLGYSAGTTFRHLGVGLPGGNIQPPAQFYYTVSAVVVDPLRINLQKLHKLAGKATRKEVEELIR